VGVAPFGVAPLLIATANRGKYKEFSELLPGVELVFAPDRVPLDVEETGSSYAANAVRKARAWAAAAGLPSLADDSGLEVEALGGRPGLRSARAAKGTDADRNRWLLAEMESLGGGERGRRARFVAAVALSVPGQWTVVREGVCEGRLAEAETGSLGFGYDSLFIPDGFDASFGELPASVKNRISHRGRAVRALLEFLENR
jgi:XTP/dITP diphosphohydrolase